MDHKNERKVFHFEEEEKNTVKKSIMMEKVQFFFVRKGKLAHGWMTIQLFLVFLETVLNFCFSQWSNGIADKTTNQDPSQTTKVIEKG